MSLGLAKLSSFIEALRGHQGPCHHGDILSGFSRPRPVPFQQRGYPRLKGVDYSEATPVLKRGKLRTLALANAQVINFRDLRANLYGCYPCPVCGEVRFRAGFVRRGRLGIECHACGDKRPVRQIVG